MEKYKKVFEEYERRRLENRERVNEIVKKHLNKVKKQLPKIQNTEK